MMTLNANFYDKIIATRRDADKDIAAVRELLAVEILRSKDEDKSVMNILDKKFDTIIDGQNRINEELTKVRERLSALEAVQSKAND